MKLSLIHQLVLVVASVSLLSVMVCKKTPVGEPPATPAAPMGITTGARNASYDFSTATTDPDSDSVCFRFQWGPGATSEWSEPAANGETVTMSHAWSDSGTYSVRAQAKDLPGNATDWSPALAVTISASRAPDAPAVPSGPAAARKDSLCTFTTIATDPDGDGISYRFAWGNGDTSPWTGWVQSGQPGTAEHAYLRSGSYQVRTQARDVHELPSAWSSALAFTVANPYRPSTPTTPTGPQNLRPGIAYQFASAASDSGGDSVSIRFSWGDGDTSSWSVLAPSGTAVHLGHPWHEMGSFMVQTQAMDEESLTSGWSLPEVVTATNVKWRYHAGTWAGTSPAVATDGTIYVGSLDSCLHAVNPDGTLKWRYRADGSVLDPAAVGADGKVYFGSFDSCFYAVTADGLDWWRHNCGGFLSAPAVAADGIVYVGSYDHNLYAFNPSGLPRWLFPTELFVNSPAVGADSTIYVGASGYLYAITTMGTLDWRYQAGNTVYASPAIGSDGTIYVGSSNDYLYAINPNGTLKWRYQTGDGVYSSAAIATDGTIYFGSDDSCLYAVNPNGTLKWRYRTGDAVSSSPAITAYGRVYVGSEDGCFYAINPDGTLEWREETGAKISSSPAVAADGTIYVGSNDGYLYAFYGNSPLASSPWPKFHHDLKNTGRVGGGR